MLIRVEVEGVEVLQQKIGKFAGALQSPFKEMDVADPLHADFLEIEEDHIQSAGHGSFPEPSPEYEARKVKLVGSIHAQLRLTDRLYLSLTRASHEDHIFDKSNPQELVFGTRVPYARAHMKAYKGRPARPPIDLRPEDVRKMQNTIKKQAAIYNRTRIGFVETEVGEVG